MRTEHGGENVETAQQGGMDSNDTNINLIQGAQGCRVLSKLMLSKF